MNTEVKRVSVFIIYRTIVSSSPGKYFSFVGHSEDVGSTAWHLNQLIAEERLDDFGLRVKTETEKEMLSL